MFGFIRRWCERKQAEAQRRKLEMTASLWDAIASAVNRGGSEEEILATFGDTWHLCPKGEFEAWARKAVREMTKMAVGFRERGWPCPPAAELFKQAQN